MKVFTLGLVAVAMLAAAEANAQVIITDPTVAAVAFESKDHGAADMQGYQAILLDAAADAASGVPVQTGPVVPRSQAIVETPATTPPVYDLTFAKLGISPPACTGLQANCKQYTIVLLAIDTSNRATARAVTAESDSFSLGSTSVQVVGPTNVKIKQR